MGCGKRALCLASSPTEAPKGVALPLSNEKGNIMQDTMTRRDLFKLGAVATTAAAGASLLGCSTANAEPVVNTDAAAKGVATVTLDESISENVLNVEAKALSINHIEGITYKQVLKPNGNTQLHLDLLVPNVKDQKFPLVVFIPGGGFTGSVPANSLVQRMAIAQAGYVVASVQHRVVPGAKFPEPLEDIKEAVRWLKANADTFNIDKTKVASMGNSSGGYFATMLGVTGDVKEFDTGDNTGESSAVNAVIDLYGVSDLSIIGAGLEKAIEQGHDSPATTEAMLINGIAFGGNKGASVFETPDTAAPASPFTYIDGSDPAFLIFHGDKDTLVSPVATMELYKRLKDAGVDATRYVVAGASHGGPMFDQPEVIDLMIEFLDKQLKSDAEKK